MYAAATNAAAYMYDTAESMYREIQRLRHGAHTHNDDQVHGPCWEEDKDDGWLMIMTPKLQREADRQRSLMRAMSLHPDQRFVCSICLDLLPFDEIFLSSACLSQCGQCCRDCSTDYVLSRISDQSFPVTCPSATCILSQQDVGGLLDEPNMLRYLMLERWDYVRKNPRCVVCPRPSADGNGCPGIVEMDEGGTIFVCPVCEHRRCVRCDVEAGAITAMSVIGFLALLTCRSISGRRRRDAAPLLVRAVPSLEAGQREQRRRGRGVPRLGPVEPRPLPALPHRHRARLRLQPHALRVRRPLLHGLPPAHQRLPALRALPPPPQRPRLPALPCRGIASATGRAGPPPSPPAH